MMKSASETQIVQTDYKTWISEHLYSHNEYPARQDREIIELVEVLICFVSTGALKSLNLDSVMRLSTVSD